MIEDNEMSLEGAIAYVAETIKNFENLSVEQQMQVREAAREIRELMAQAEHRQQELDRAAAARRNQTAHERKKLRDELIPQWCENNLQPGMIIKVKAKNAGWRRVIEVTPAHVLSNGYRIEGSVKTQHVGYRRLRDPESGELSWSLQEGDYLTSHVLTNVQGVVLRRDRQGKPVLTPIMELAESINE